MVDLIDDYLIQVGYALRTIYRHVLKKVRDTHLLAWEAHQADSEHQ